MEYGTVAARLMSRRVMSYDPDRAGTRWVTRFANRRRGSHPARGVVLNRSAPLPPLHMHTPFAGEQHAYAVEETRKGPYGA